MAWEIDGNATEALFNGTTACADQSRSVLIQSEWSLYSFCLANLVHANRFPPRVASGSGFRLKTPGSRPRLPGAVDAVFETGQLLGADRATGVKFAGGDPDFRAEAEFAAVGKLGRCVMQHDRRIDLVEKFARDGFVFRHDRIGVLRTVVMNMRDRFLDAVDHFGGDDRVLVFGIPVVLGSGLHPEIRAFPG